MRKIFPLLALGLSPAAAWAQRADTVRAVAPETTPGGSGGVTWWMLIALPLLVGGMLYLFWRSGRKGGDNVRGLDRRPRAPVSAGQEAAPKPMKSKKKSGFQNIQGAVPTGEVSMTTGVEKIQKTALPEEPVAKQPEAIAEEAPEVQADPAPAPLPPKPEPPKPQIFYMTVPSADGRFPVSGQKMQPAGCLYQFEVPPAQPAEAQIRFAGSEADMRNAQAFRDLELLPACTFSNLPQGNSFRFEQTPGRAVLEGEAWVVKGKIVIKFL